MIVSIPAIRPLGEELQREVRVESPTESYNRRRREERERIMKYVRSHNKHVRPAPEK